jgi:predicted LPLAT superfamily acyltransferase
MTDAAHPEPATAGPDSGRLRWSGRTRGGYWGNWFFVQWIRWFGLRSAYAWLAVITVYFTLFSRGAYRASADYLRRVLGPCPAWRQPLRVYRHLLAFGITLLDRIAVIMGRADVHCDFEGEELLVECLHRGQGIILLGAHLGSWEIGSQLLARLGKPINLVVLEREQAHIRHLFDQALQNRQFRILTADADPLRSVPILAALRRGEIVALHGDRSLGHGDLPVPFLGGTAHLPIGPYHLAAIARSPVFQVFVVRERLGHYRFFTFPAQSVDRNAARQGPEGLRPHAELYAARLETVCRQYPHQWFNLYPFWAPAKPVANAR